MSTALSSSSRKVLLIDDDEAIRMTLRFILEDNGYAVEEAADGVDALNLIEGGASPSVIILDLMMPRMDGWEFHQKYRKRALERGEKPAPVIIISAFRDRPTPDDVAAVLPKPFTMAAMLEAIRKLAP